MADPIEELRKEHERTGRAPGSSTLSKGQTQLFISSLIILVVAFAGLIAFIVTSQQADPEVLEKMEQIKTEMTDDRKEALKDAPSVKEEREVESN